MEGLTHAPEINRPGLDWLNTDRPLDLPSLRGKLIILDFWTYCCINCMHIQPTLARIENAFPNEVVVIGIHSPKFPAERDLENVRRAIARLGIRHPVIHDPNMVLWQEYVIRAWPTLTFISPDGMVIGNLAGEAKADRLLLGIRNMLKDWRASGVMMPSRFSLVTPPLHEEPLCFPGKIKPVPGPKQQKRWAVADTGHHQIAVMDDDGKTVARFGSGAPGFLDSDAGASTFSSPQGLVATETHIYVADTGNHAIRRIDLKDGTVCTVAGTGARGAILSDEAPGTETPLASPWDLEIMNGHVFFANAGSHQLGVLNTETGTVKPLAGTGAENILDGTASDSLLAQPSGLTLDPDKNHLYFADSETSSIRMLDMNGMPSVRTLIGTDLFDHGRADGPFDVASLQHPLGLSIFNNTLIVADSFNNRICVLDLKARTLTDLKVDDFACADDTCLGLSEPAGLACDGITDKGGRILVSDTNNHRIMELDLAQRQIRQWAG